MGEVAITVRQRDGILDCTWAPVRHARFVGDTQPQRGHQARFALRHDERGYDLFATAYNSTEFARIREREEREYLEKFHDRPDTVEVMTGSAAADFRDRAGKILPSGVGIGRTFIISQDTAAAQEYASRAFPNRRDVVIVGDKAEAEAKLREAWAEARRRSPDGAILFSHWGEQTSRNSISRVNSESGSLQTGAEVCMMPPTN